MQFHPDKVGSQGADHFVLLKTAFDTLTDPAHRFAYERFGPSMLDWENCKTPYDYVFHGASALVPTYGGSLGVLIVIAVLGKFNVGRWWRFYVLSALLMFEFALVSRPFPLLPALPLLKPLLAFEQSALARKIAITSFVALNQLGPGLGAKESKVGLEEDLEKVVKTLAIVKAEAAKAQQTEFLPFEKDLVTQKTLEKKISSFLAESAIRNDPEVRAAVVNVMKSRADAARAQKDE